MKTAEVLLWVIGVLALGVGAGTIGYVMASNDTRYVQADMLGKRRDYFIWRFTYAQVTVLGFVAFVAGLVLVSIGTTI
jgi:hypothetical protein